MNLGTNLDEMHNIINNGKSTPTQTNYTQRPPLSTDNTKFSLKFLIQSDNNVNRKVNFNRNFYVGV